MQQSAEEAIAATPAIFEATVTAIADNTTTEFGGRDVSMNVTRAWKGIEEPSVTVITASNSAACGFPFSVGTTYLVYAYRAEKTGQLRVSLCSHTKPADQAKADLALLGKPTPLATPKGATPKAEDKGRCSASGPHQEGSPLAIAALAIGAWVFGRRRLGRTTAPE